MPQFDVRFVAGFLVRIACAALFTYPCMVLLFNTTPIAIRFEQWPAQVLLGFSAVLFVAILVLQPRPRTWSPSRGLVVFWVTVFLLAAPFALIKIVMGDNRIEPIAIFLGGNNMSEVLAVGRGSYAGLLARAAVLFGVFALLLIYLVRRYVHMEKLVSALFVALVALHPVTNYAFGRFVPNPLHDEFDIDLHFANPAAVTKPAQPKNLVLVYLESLEATFARLPETAPAFAPLEALRDGAFTASNIHQVEGTRYTIAGLVATQCGVPLIPHGLNDIGFDHRTPHSLTTFMPSITCLGDILARDGYRVSYMNGASLERYSKRGFLTSHGYERLFGLESVDPAVLGGRENLFGMNDALLFEHAHRELDTLHASGRPFLLTLLTVGTHGPDGFPDADCPRADGEIGGLAAGIRCAGQLIESLVAALERKGLADDTLVAVMSDHLMINQQLIEAPALGRSLRGVREGRRNLFFIHGMAPAKRAKPASMIDVFPTLLEAIGYTLDEHRANFGVSLLADAPTLVETYGAQQVDELFLQNMRLARMLWRERPQAASRSGGGR